MSYNTKEKEQIYYSKNREKIIVRNREAFLIRTYGITSKQYEELWADQKGLCRICEDVLVRGTGAGRNGGNVHLDHDKVTGKVRGLLCVKHNMGLGFYNHDPKLLRKAAEYIERYG